MLFANKSFGLSPTTEESIQDFYSVLEGACT